ncbi:hypothetical protein X975_24543, partial [Stegodyphus mimosarum]
MASKCNLLQLPDLVLHNICTFITCPFDLLHFGNACSRLRSVSLSQSLWWSIAFHWCKGLWTFIKRVSDSEDPREWMLYVIKQYTRPPAGTRSECSFTSGEKWERSESRKFRFLFGLLHLVYKKEKSEHPAILFEEWLYDIGLYNRIGTCFDYTVEKLQFHHDDILQLTSLGQAIECDLRRIEHPCKDPASYIKRIATVDTNWMSLFPSGLHGPVCPLLINPLLNCVTYEKYGLEGLAVCLSIVLEKHIQTHAKFSKLTINKVFNMISVFCMHFKLEIARFLPKMQSRVETQPLKSAVLSVIERNILAVDKLQDILNSYEVNISCKDIFCELSNFLANCRGIDFVVDEVQMHIRKSIIGEINKILFPNNTEKCIVTRINLTDSDLIGGDNSQQEMAAAAFISPNGVLVTWHLVGGIFY